MLAHSSRRVWTPPSAGEIVGKPTAPFQPNTGYAKYPNLSALYFTDLISGQTDYVEDSIAGRADFSYTTGSFGFFAPVEGFQAAVASGSSGGVNDTAGLTGTNSFASLFEFWSTDPGAWSYCMGYGTATTQTFSVLHSTCGTEGLFQFSVPFCLGVLNDSQLHRICLRQTNNDAGQDRCSIAVDGVMVHDKAAYTTPRNNIAFNVARNSNGRSALLTFSGLWEWVGDRSGTDILTDQEMLDLTTDPWPYLAVLD